tara:strand:- start:11659 stop:11871 length:213 start_codon:yes stop_codon:yes gene_type:complete
MDEGLVSSGHIMFLRDVAIHADKAIVSNYKDGFVLILMRSLQRVSNEFLLKRMLLRKKCPKIRIKGSGHL